MNKKSSLKFFEKYNKKRNHDKGIYDNQESGLLIYDKLINSDKFEYYIQPPNCRGFVRVLVPLKQTQKSAKITAGFNGAIKTTPLLCHICMQQFRK